MAAFQTLYVMRHGQTHDNVANLITGQADSQLTALGLEQAAGKGRLLRQQVGNLDALAFIASPLHRACVTMEIARGAASLAAQSYSTDARLMEMAFGAWTGLQEGEDRFGPGLPSAHEAWDLRPPGGESQADVYERTGSFLQSVRQDSVIVCHARVLCMIRSHLLKLTPSQTMQFEPSNAGYLRLSPGSETWFRG